MRLSVLAGLYVAVVLSAQVGANKIIKLPLTHLEAPGGVYAIGVALALVQLAHYTGATRREGAVNAQLLIALGFVGSALFAGYIALIVHSEAAFPGQAFDRAVGSTWRIVTASLAAFIVSETVDNPSARRCAGAFTTACGSPSRPARARPSTASSSSCSPSAPPACTSSGGSSWGRSRRRS